MYFGSLFMSYGIKYEFYEEIPSQVGLTVFIMLNDSFRAKRSYLLGFLMKYKKWDNINSTQKKKTIGPCKCNLCYFEPTCISFASHCYCSFPSILNVPIEPIQCIQSYLKLRPLPF